MLSQEPDHLGPGEPARGAFPQVVGNESGGNVLVKRRLANAQEWRQLAPGVTGLALLGLLNERMYHGVSPWRALTAG